MHAGKPDNAPLVMIIRDGWGRNPNREHDDFNAVRLARTPIDDALRARWPSTLIHTSGDDVGLLAGTMGNSEVGHQNIGAGRIVAQDALRITHAIREGPFFENDELLAALRHASERGTSLHLMGLVSDGRVHSDLDHLHALIDLAARRGFPRDRLFVQAFTDGRDTGPATGLGFLRDLEAKLEAAGVGRIASVCGRYYAMDRDNRWNRVALAYRCLTGRGTVPEADETVSVQITDAPSAVAAVERYYDAPTEPSRTGDEFIAPTRIVDPAGEPIGLVGDGDAVVFFNYRGDRPRELTRAFMLAESAWSEVAGGGFDRGTPLRELHYGTLTAYEQSLPVTGVAFLKSPPLRRILGAVISDAGLAQFRCAETEKYPHVTFFFNDYRDDPFPGERRELVRSPQEISTYDQKPEMSAPQVCDAVVRRLEADDAEPLVVVNFANGDMVGHTGRLDAAIRAIEVVDACVGRVVAAASAHGGSAIVTADHGNAEQMWDPVHDCPHTAHTTYDVPLILVGEPWRGGALRTGGRLADIAPTALAMLGREQPAEMTGRSLLA